MVMNIISYQFANNFSNINLPGYLYIKKETVCQEEEVEN